MGRVKIYKTKEEKMNAIKERSKIHYEKYKEINKEMYNISASRTYYRHRILEDPKNKDIYQQKIDLLTNQLKELRNNTKKE